MSNATCPVCGSTELPKKQTGPRATYCSQSCRRRASYSRRKAAGTLKPAKRRAGLTLPDRACVVCGASFSPKQRRSSYCSKKCVNTVWRAKRPVCSEAGCDNASVSLGLCRRHHPSAKSWSRGNPETRKANLRRKTQQRRARTQGLADAPLIDRNFVGDRDGWRCGICRGRVERDLAYPSPQSASLDHIVPLSLGGSHSLDNVQISHLSCNLRKSNRVGDVQPLLVG